MAVLLGLLVATTYGGADFMGGLASQRSAAKAVLLTSQACSALIAVVGLAIVGLGAAASHDVIYAILAGCSGAIALGCFYPALRIGPMSMVAPITATISGATPVLYGLITGQTVSVLAGAGVVGALASAALISRPHESHPTGGRRWAALSLSVGGGLGFGAATIFLARVSASSGIGPAFIVRFATFGLLVVIWTGTKGPIFPARRDVPLAVAVGIAETGGTLLVLYAVRNTQLVIFAPVAALGPAIVVIAARFVLHEKLGRPQLFGLGLAAVALALISVG
jgi:drug/metabolite transporter (DMT)-like permease